MLQATIGAQSAHDRGESGCVAVRKSNPTVYLLRPTVYSPRPPCRNRRQRCRIYRVSLAFAP